MIINYLTYYLKEMMERKKNRKDKRWLVVAVVTMGMFVNTHLCAQVITENYPAEKLITRLNKISKSGAATIAYDAKIIGNIEVSGLSADQDEMEQVLNKSLLSTGFTYRRAADGSYIVVRKSAVAGPVADKVKLTGTVVGTNGEPIIGASVVVKGSANGVATDVDGNFTIDVPPNSVLQVSYLGYITKEVHVGKEKILKIELQEDTYALNEVVVTALGISREKKALGYSVQDLKGDDLGNLNSNFSSALSGKIAGVSVNTNSVAGGTARVVIRGESSLNYQSNQPLFVIDGIPVGNDAVQNFTNADYGNSSAEFNPSDVENISVLKGPAASALYGSRAANGVILITTKSGKSQKGLGISYSGTFTKETSLILPKMQRLFGQGKNGIYEGGNFGYSNNGLYPDGVNDTYDESWGPRFDGKPRVQFDSPTDNGHRAGDVYLTDRGNPIATPWVANPDNMKDFFDGGHTLVNNVAISNSNDHSAFRLSYTHYDQNGLVPNNNVKRHTFSTNSSYTINQWLEASVSASYVKTKSTNRPYLGYGRETPMYFFIWLPQSHNINSYRDYWQPGLEGLHQFQGNYGENHNNPYFYQYENTSGQDKDKFFGNLKLDVGFNDHLKLIVRGGIDFYNDFRPRQMAYSTADYPQGFYEEVDLRFQENNYDALLSYQPEMGSDFGVMANLGASYMDRTQKTSRATAKSLTVPGLYSLENSVEKPDVNSYGYHKRTNSVYGSVQLNYRHAVFLDITGRNDWSSALPVDNNSYFYPSVTGSILLNELLEMPEYLNYLKLRGGYAQVGNDTDPYNLRAVYNTNGFFGSNALISEESALKNKALKPERISTIEAGLEFSLFNDRLRTDLSWYRSDSKDQILNLQSTPTTGYNSRVLNAGKIRNSGIELVVSGTPVKLENGFTWDLSMNFARNRGKVLSLAEGINELVISSPGEDAKMVAKVGERMGELYGPGFERVKEGPLAGQIIIGSNGLPVKTSDPILLGNVNPDWTMGLGTQFAFKGFSLGVLFDIRQGGVFVSRTINKGIGAGQLIETEAGRGAREPGKEYDDPYYLEGAALLDDGSYAPNLTVFDGTYSQGVYGTDARSFHKDYYDHNSEAQLVDASFVKMRELKFGYTFPQKWISKAMIKSLSLYFVGQNLFLWTDNQHLDPEAAMANTGNGLVQGFENLSVPSSRSLGFQLNVSF